MSFDDSVEAAMNNKNNTALSSHKDNKVGFWAVVISVLAAAFGVQSNKNRERDFSHGNIWVYVIAGVIFTAIFVMLIMLAVKFSLSQIAQ